MFPFLFSLNRDRNLDFLSEFEHHGVCQKVHPILVVHLFLEDFAGFASFFKQSSEFINYNFQIGSWNTYLNFRLLNPISSAIIRFQLVFKIVILDQ
jgi:hypothetical protein